MTCKPFSQFWIGYLPTHKYISRCIPYCIITILTRFSCKKFQPITFDFRHYNNRLKKDVAKCRFSIHLIRKWFPWFISSSLVFYGMKLGSFMCFNRIVDTYVKNFKLRRLKSTGVQIMIIPHYFMYLKNTPDHEYMN